MKDLGMNERKIDCEELCVNEKNDCDWKKKWVSRITCEWWEICANERRKENEEFFVNENTACKWKKKLVWRINYVWMKKLHATKRRNDYE